MQSRVEEQQFITAGTLSSEQFSNCQADMEEASHPFKYTELKKDFRNFNYAPYTSTYTAFKSR